MRPGRRFAVLLFSLILTAVLLFFLRNLWLRQLATALIRQDNVSKADAILVLAGDFTGSRIMKACELASNGYAPVVLVSGPIEFYGTNEADLAVRYAAGRGCPAQVLVPFRMQALSTVEEASRFQSELQRRGFHDVLIVTSNFHTGRAGRIFEHQFGSDIRVRMVPAPFEYFNPDNWWTSREGQKTIFFEYCKVFATAVGL